MLESPFRDLILLDILLPQAFIPVSSLFFAGIGKDGNVGEFFQNRLFQIADPFLVRTVHFGQDDHDRSRILLLDLLDHLLVGFEKPVVGRRHTVPDLMDVLAHIIEILPELFPDGTQDIFHKFLFIRTYVITLAVIQSNGGSFRTVGMDSGRPGAALIADFRALLLTQLKNITDHRALPDSGRTADQDVGLADFLLHLPECFLIVKVLKIKSIHLYLPPGQMVRYFRQNKFSVFQKGAELFGRGLLPVIDPVLCRVPADTYGIDHLLCPKGRVHMKQNGILHHLHNRVLPLPLCQVYHDQLFKAALYQRHVGRIVPASSVPVFKMIDPYGSIDKGQCR